jgi:hypothetical protein
MAQAADTGAGNSPYAKFVEVGDTLVGAFGSAPRACVRQATKFGTGELLFKENGKPLNEEVMWFVACPGTTAKKGNVENGYEDIEPLDTVLFAVQGFKWGQVIEARKALPAAAGFKAGQACSGDIYTISLVGWSAETVNPAAAVKAGFTVVDSRIVLRTQDEKDAYVLDQSRKGGNTNPAKDYSVTVRRPTAADKAYEQAADEMFLAKPWQRTLALVGAGAAAADEEEVAF